MITRRGLLGGLIAAPAVVAAGSLMPVRSIERILLLHENALLDECVIKDYAPGDFAIEGWVKTDVIWRHITLTRDHAFVNGVVGEPTPKEITLLLEFSERWGRHG